MGKKVRSKNRVSPGKANRTRLPKDQYYHLRRSHHGSDDEFIRVVEVVFGPQETDLSSNPNKSKYPKIPKSIRRAFAHAKEREAEREAKRFLRTIGVPQNPTPTPSWPPKDWMRSIQGMNADMMFMEDTPSQSFIEDNYFLKKL